MAKLNIQTNPSNNTVVQGQSLTANIASTIGTGIFVTDDQSLENSLQQIFGDTQNLPDNNKNVVDNIVDLDNKIDTTKNDLINTTDSKIAVAKQDITQSVTQDVDLKLAGFKGDVLRDVDAKVDPLKLKVNTLEQTTVQLDTDTKQMFNLFNQDLNGKFSQLDNKLTTEIANVTNTIDGKILVETGKVVTDYNQKFQDFETKVDSDLSDAKQELSDKIDNALANNPSLAPLEQRLDTLEPKVDNLELNYGTLESKHNLLDKKVDGLEIKVNANTNKVNALESTVNTEIKKIPALVSNVQDIDAKVDDNLNITKQKVTEISDKVDQEVLKLTQKVDVITGKVDPLDLKVSSLENNVNALDTKVSNNEQSILTINNKIAATDQKATQAIAEANKATQTIATIEQQVTKLEGDIQDANNNVSDLSNKVDSNLNEINLLKQKDLDLEQKVDSTEVKVTGLTSKIDQNERNITNLTSKLNTVEQKANEIDAVKVSVSDLDNKTDQALQSIRADVSGIKQEQTGIKQGLQSVSGNVTTLEQTVTQLENKVQNGNQSVTGLENRIQTAETKITAAEQGLQLSLAGLDAANKKALQLETDLTSTTQRVDGLEPKVTTVEQGIQSLQGKVNTNTQAVQDLTSKVTDVTQKTADLDSKIDNVDAKIDPLSKKLTQVEATVTSNTQTANTALQKANNAESIANGIDKRVSVNEGDISDLKLSVSDLETARDDVKQDIKDLQTKDVKLEANYSVMNNKVTANEQAVNQMKTDVANLKQKDIDLDRTVQVLDGKVTNMKQSVDTVAQKVGNIEGSVQTITGQVTDLEVKDTELEKKDTQLEQSITGLTQTVSGLDTKLGQVENNVNTVSGKITQLETTVSQNTQKVDDAVQKVNQNQNRLDTLDANVSDLQQKDTELEQLIQDTDSKIDPVKQSVVTLTQKVGTVENNLNSVTTRVGDLETKAKQLADKDTQIEQTVTTLEQTVTNHGQTLGNLNTTIDGKVNTAKQELTQNMSDLNDDINSKLDTINNTTIPGLDTKLDTKIDTTKIEITNETDDKLRLMDRALDNKINNMPLTFNVDEFSQFTTRVFVYKENISGMDVEIGNNPLGPVYRAPSIKLGDDGVLHVVADVRENGEDEARSEIAYARSFDGGKTWEKQIIGRRLKTGTNVDEPTSRVNKPTLLYAGNNTLYVLAGRWTKGSQPWNAIGSDSADNWESALLIKSIDNGTTWTQHTIGKSNPRNPEGNHIIVSGLPSGCKGFLGGIDGAIKHSSGALLFGIQFTTGNGDSKVCILRSINGGSTWSISSASSEGLNYDPALIELPDGKVVLHCRSDDPDAVLAGKSMKKAFMTPDFGDYLIPYSPLTNKIGAIGNTGNASGDGFACQGALFSAKTLSGRYVIGACYPQNTLEDQFGNNTDPYGRNQITFYGINFYDHVSAPLGMIKYTAAGSTNGTGNTPGTTGTLYGGYTSLTYNQSLDGEYLVCGYEDNLGISIKNLTDLIPRLESYCDPDDDIVKDRFRDYFMLVDTTKLPYENFGNIVDNSNRFFGNFLVKGYTGSDSLTASEIVKNGYRFKVTNKSNTSRTSNGIRAWVSFPDQATTLSVSLLVAFPDPSRHSITNDSWFPLFKLGFDFIGNNWTGGVNMNIPANPANTKIELVRGRSGQNILGWPGLEYDKVYHVVVEYTSAGVHLFIDGRHMGSSSYDPAVNIGSVISSTRALAMGGDWYTKSYISEIGNFYVFPRALTEIEKRYGIYKTADPVTYSIFENVISLNEDLRKEINTLKTELRKTACIAAYPDFANIPQIEHLKLNLLPLHFAKNSTENNMVLHNDVPIFFKEENTALFGYGNNVTNNMTNDTSGYSTNGFIYLGRNKVSHSIDITSFGLDSGPGFSIEYRWKISGSVVRSQPNGVCFYICPSGVYPGGQNFITGYGFALKSHSQSTVNSQKFALQGGFVIGPTTNNAFGDLAPDTLCKMMVVVEGRNFKIYIDGVEAMNETTNNDWSVGMIGFLRSNNNAIFSSIEVHALRAWSKALTPQEVQQMTNLA